MALQFFVNGKLITEKNPDPNSFLVGYLRRKVGLTGTKVACGEGGCGSCTVLLSKFDDQTHRFTHNAINACITPLCSVQACHILTIEGLSGVQDSVKSCHFLQDAIAQGNGTQCGFCTPGMVMSVHGLMCSKDSKKNGSLGVDDIKDALQGNLCRCTGYRPILEAFRKCPEMSIEDLPKRCDTPCLEDKRAISLEARTTVPQIETLLDNFMKSTKLEKNFGVENVSSWFRPNTLEELVKILKTNPGSRVIGGATQLALENPNESNNSKYVHIGLIPEMRAVKLEDKHVKLGAALTISEMIEELKKLVEILSHSRTKHFRTILRLLEKFGSAQIRNAATIGGSIMTDNDASDIQTLFAGVKARAECFNSLKPVSSNEFLRVEDIWRNKTPGIVVIAVEIPLTEKTHYSWAHKVIRRTVNDAAIMNFTISVIMNDKLDQVDSFSMSMGGRAIERFTLALTPTTDAQKRISSSDGFLKHLSDSVALMLQSNGCKNGFQPGYCQPLAKNLCTKFCNWLANAVKSESDEDVKKRGFKSVQVFDKTNNDQPITDLVGKPIPHASAYKHATGEARFLDDIPKHKNELSLVFVLSERPHAIIKSVDVSQALALEGVVGYVDKEDISSPEKNRFGLVVKDEEIFASEKVNCVGQIIGGILGKTRAIARRALKLVKVIYEDVNPCLFTIDDAIQHNSFYPDFGIKLESGNCAQDFPGTMTLTGKFEIGTQAHFYMEPQSCLAVPNGEDGEMEVISSTQNPMDTQLHVADVLDVPANRIVVKVKRVGGGFGGKESRSLMVALPVAIAAKKFGVPVRCILDRKTDMLISGKRNPFMINFDVTFDQNGRITCLQFKVYCNAGHSLDVSNAAIERCLINIDNAYNIPNFKGEGFVCKTNIASNTVFRGTGAPQAALIIENILDLVASHLRRDPLQVRQLNLYSEGDVTPYGQALNNYTIQKCWDECLKASNYYERLKELEEFNRKNEWKKRGISVNPAHYGVAYTALFLNQASALINVYRDGSVQLSHGGVEIGQGLHSKMTQVATRELGISSDKIRILETATDKVPNGTPTSASSSSDLNGMAVIDACQKLMKRLEPYKSADPTLSWEQIVIKAYMDRVSLAATGFYKIPGIGWNEVTKKGNPFNYFSTGVACTEVELDCLTGQHQILRTDIVMDVGRSLNPAIDLGQIEGAFMQGVGFYTLEDLQFGKSGEVVTLGPNSYKIPTIADIPLEFNVSFLSGSQNPRAVYSSKTVGEPPLLLATSVFFALKDAIRRKVKTPVFELNSPATVEKVLMALQGN